MKTFLLLLLPLSLLAGCGGDSSPTGTDGAVGTPPPAAEDTAEASLRAIMDGLRNGQPIVAWNAMPESYQNDTNSLVQTFAQNMDEQIWKSVTDVLSTVHTLLIDKHEFIMNHPTIADADDPEASRESVTHITGLLKTILDTAGDLEKLKTFDGAQFMSSTGSDLMNHFDTLAKLGARVNPAAAAGPIGLASLENVKIETLTSTDTTATLKITSPDGKVETKEFVKTQDKWLPAEMVKDWDQKVAEAKTGLANLSDQEQVAQMRMGVMMATGMASGLLSQLQATQTQEEFDAAVASIQQSAMGMMGGGMGAPPGGNFGPPDGNDSPSLHPTSGASAPEPAEAAPAE